MRHETKKICRIVDELTTLFLKEDTNEVDFKIKKDTDKAVISIVDYGTHFSEEDVRYFREMLGVQRQCEIEEYYWQLAGETDDEEELTLVGAMIDEVKIEREMAICIWS